MAYTLLNDNPFAPTKNCYVVLDYDYTTELFSVTCPHMNSNYTVHRHELIDIPLKYQHEIINEILDQLPEDQDFAVLVTNMAQNSIHLICTVNRSLY